ncbi:MAG: hypothetical protein LBT05_04365 [Planctomycetaceae bacterium]|nr:hypothetical protein [Planctomycetaceae bacterium]
MSNFCPYCGSALANPNQVICLKCGCAVAPTNRARPINYADLQEPWNGGTFVLFIVLTLFVPLVGIILGAINLSSAKNSEKRRTQALTLLIIGGVAVFINTFFLFVFFLILSQMA